MTNPRKFLIILSVSILVAILYVAMTHDVKKGRVLEIQNRVFYETAIVTIWESDTVSYNCECEKRRASHLKVGEIVHMRNCNQKITYE